MGFLVVFEWPLKTVYTVIVLLQTSSMLMIWDFLQAKKLNTMDQELDLEVEKDEDFNADDGKKDKLASP